MRTAAVRSIPEARRDTARFPESVLRPLGRGYLHADGFLTDYLRPQRQEENAAPDASISLRHLEAMPGIARHLAKLRRGPSCLIQGYSTPSNGVALRAFLERHGVTEPDVAAFDLIDMQSICDRLGIPMDGVEFQVADACNLTKQYRTGSVDLVLQDHLFNCSPPSLHGGIASEMARVLRRSGLAIVNYTDSQGFECCASSGVPARAVIRKMIRRSDAYCIQDVVRPGDAGEILRAIAGKCLRIPGMPGCVLVTAPHGNFEFYRPLEEITNLLARNRLQVLSSTCSTGKDSHGNICTRHRILGRKT